LDLEDLLKAAVIRAYSDAGLRLQETHAISLSRTYAAWAQDADDGVVDRLERTLAASLGVKVSR